MKLICVDYRLQILTIWCISLLFSSVKSQGRHFNNGKSGNQNGQYFHHQKNPSSNNYWYEYWYNSDGTKQGNNFQIPNIPPSNEVGNSYEWHSSSNGNSGENNQQWNHQEKRALFNLPGGFQGNPGLKNGNTNSDYFVNLLNSNGINGVTKQHFKQNNGNHNGEFNKFDQPNNNGQNNYRQWFQNNQPIFQNHENNNQQNQQNNVANDYPKWQEYHTYQSGPNFKQNNGNFEKNNPNFDQNGRNFKQNNGNFEKNNPNFDQNGGSFKQNNGNFVKNNPNFDQNGHNFQQNNGNYRNFHYNNNFDQNDGNNYSTSEEDYFGPDTNLSQDYDSNNFPGNNHRRNSRNSTSTPPLSFWIDAPNQNQPQINRTRQVVDRNWFRPGTRRNNNIQPTRGEVNPPSAINPGRPDFNPIEDELGQIDLLVEAQQFCGRDSDLEEDTETTIRIARGHAATEMYPWLVAIYQAAPGKKMQFICGGSLITSKHAITAAHCFLSRDSMQYEFIISNNRIVKPSEAAQTLRKASGIMLHPGYNPQVTPANADVAVVIFERPVEFGNLIKPICMWRGDNNIRSISNEIGRIVGWGADENLAIADDLPMEINMGILDYKTCIVKDTSFINIVGENSFCTGYRNGSGPCMGDSGSGFMLKQGERWSLRGIVSLTTRLVGCDINHYVGMTDVAKYHAWISSILRRT